MIKFVVVARDANPDEKEMKKTVPLGIAELTKVRGEVLILLVEEDDEGEAFLQTLNRVRNKYQKLFKTDKITLVAV